MQKFSIFILVLTLMACKGQQADHQDVRQDAKASIDQYYADVRKDGLKAGLKYLDSSAQFFWVPAGAFNYVGYDSMAAGVHRMDGMLKFIDNRYDSLLIIPLTADYAQFAMRTISTTVSPEGDTGRIAFVESGVMVHRKDGWKFLSGHTSLLE